MLEISFDPGLVAFPSPQWHPVDEHLLNLCWAPTTGLGHDEEGQNCTAKYVS
jgi:hypothetical protein